MNDYIFVDVDTQFDFMNPKGKLYVPGAETIVPTLKQLFDFARQREITILSSVDAHTLDDPEFEIFPPHCVKGSAGQEKLPETLNARVLFVENSPDLEIDIHPGGQIVLEKQTFSLFTNAQVDRILKGIVSKHCIVFGVATDYCVKAAVLGLVDRGYLVTVVTDAIRAVSEEGKHDAMDEMRNKGVAFKTAQEVMAEIA